jgi:hypothetical protein
MGKIVLTYDQLMSYDQPSGTNQVRKLRAHCSLFRQNVSTLSRGLHQAVGVFTKPQGVRLPDGIPFGTVYIGEYNKMEHTKIGILVILIMLSL